MGRSRRFKIERNEAIDLFESVIIVHGAIMRRDKNSVPISP